MLRLILCFLVAGFASGSVLYSMVLPRWLRGVDVVALSDDHNPGTANAMKYAGRLVGTLCLPVSYTHLDVYKRQVKSTPGGE